MSTVKTHRVNITNKLEIENLSQLIQFAIELGIVEVGQQSRRPCEQLTAR